MTAVSLSKASRLWTWVLSIGFLAAILLAAAFNALWIAALPLVLIVAWCAIAQPNTFFLLLAFFTPLSVNLEELQGGWGISLPTEPMMLLLLGIVGIMTLRNNHWRKVPVGHPVVGLTILYILWGLLCTLTSELPLVSLKAMTARIWFIGSIFGFGLLFFRTPGNAQRFWWCLAVSIAIVAIYTVGRHSLYGFEQKPAHWVMQPFFKDHTSYGAILAFLLPFSLSQWFSRYNTSSSRALGGILTVVIVTGLIFSYTRAAWVSLVAALGCWAALKLRLRPWTLLILVAIMGTFAGYLWQEKQHELAKNKSESSTDLEEHVKSISNVASDASNLERINRWNCAIRMFEKRPWVGWGPGTYSFLYAPFQHSSELTIISTNFGDLGNAHSEYLGPLAEMGWPGALLFVVLVITILFTAMRCYYHSPPGKERQLLLVTLLGWVSYLCHGVLNNFLDLDKAAVPFWATVALIVVLDLKRRQQGLDQPS